MGPNNAASKPGPHSFLRTCGKCNCTRPGRLSYPTDCRIKRRQPSRPKI
jgi:hypothetical protein